MNQKNQSEFTILIVCFWGPTIFFPFIETNATWALWLYIAIAGIITIGYFISAGAEENRYD